ncbi:MAG: hypothetical protein ACJ735_09865 [Actinomycetes bacterium]
MSCPAVGICSAIGTDYGDATVSPIWMARYVNGAWTTQDLPLPAGISTRSHQLDLLGLSCPSADWCLAVGTARDYQTADTSMFVDVFANGRWSASTLPVPRDADAVGANPTALALDCPTVAACTIGATYVDANWTSGVPFELDLVGGRWSARLMPVPHNAADPPPDPGWMMLSCPAPGSCVSAYMDETDSGDELTVAEAGQLGGLPSFALGTESGGGVSTFVWNLDQQTSGWRNLGGATHAPPAVIPGDDEPLAPVQPVYYVTGTNQLVYTRTLWNGWARIARSPRCLGSPAAIQAHVGPGSWADIVACAGVDHHLHVFLGSGWKDLGGDLALPPAVADLAGVPTFFVVQADHVLYRRTLNMSYASMHATCGSAPSAATTPDRARADLACAGLDHRLRVWTDYGDGWSLPVDRGGVVVGAPGVSANDAGPLFFAEGTDGAVWMRDAAHWSRLGGRATGGVAAAALN